MLASLLPGIRELRAPLAAGYVWLLGLWLTLRATPVPTDFSTGIYRDLVDLANWAGKPAVFAASAFVAYLTGIISISFTNFLSAVLNAATRGRVKELSAGTISVDNTLSEAIINRLAKRFVDDPKFQSQVLSHIHDIQDEYMKRELGRAMVTVWYKRTEREHEPRQFPQYLESPVLFRSRAVADAAFRASVLALLVDVEQLVKVARKDLELMSPRLVGKDDAIHGDYDRLVSEGTFRISMFLPMCYLFGMLAWLLNPWWTAGLVVPWTLLYLGLQSHNMAREHLAVAIMAERIESPELERIVRADVPFAPYLRVALLSKRADIPHTRQV